MKYSPEQQMLFLHMLKGFTYKSWLDLNEYFPEITPGEIIESPTKYLSANQIKGFEELKGKFPESVDELESRNIQFITILDDKYPRALKQISDPPLILFYYGNIDILNNSKLVSVVGTRNPSGQYLQHCKMLVKGIIAQGFTVVSGLAVGIDRCAHQVALDNNSPSIAIMPASVDNITPLANSSTYYSIIENGGLIVSEFPPLTEIKAGLFPRRNRIIAGLTEHTVVVEGLVKSGALITAKLAFNYGRSVYALPHPVGYSGSGNNYLIKSNIAQLIENSSDLIKAMGYELHDIDISKLPKNEQIIIELVAQGKFDLDLISSTLEIDVSELYTILTRMELSKQIKKNEHGNYAVV